MPEEDLRMLLVGGAAVDITKTSEEDFMTPGEALTSPDFIIPDDDEEEDFRSPDNDDDFIIPDEDEEEDFMMADEEEGVCGGAAELRVVGGVVAPLFLQKMRICDHY